MQPGPSIRSLRRGKIEIGTGLAPSERSGRVAGALPSSPPAETAVTTGENQGRTVRYHNVVRELDHLGVRTGRTRAYDEPQASAGDLKSAVLVQAKGGGRILAVFAPDAN